MTHLNVRIGEHIGISLSTKKEIKPKGSAVSNHLLLCNHSPIFEHFSVLTKKNNIFIRIERKSLNNIYLYLFILIFTFILVLSSILEH